MPALSASFVDWDDDDLLFNEIRYRTLTLDHVAWMFSTSYAGHWQPLTWLSYSLDFHFWGLEPFGFHLTNVLLHAASMAVVYFLARRLLRIGADRASQDACSEASSSAKIRTLAAGAAALLFAIHPLRVESVAWVSERRDVLAAFFFLFAVSCHLRYVQAMQRGRSTVRPLVWYAATLTSCGLSLLAKATAVTLPLVLLILDAYPLGRFRRTDVARVPDSRIWLEKLPFLTISLLVGVRALIAQNAQGALAPPSEHTLSARFAQACYGIVFYLRKTVWPTNLGPLYELPSRDVLLGNMFWWSLLGLGLMVMIAIAAHRRLPALTAALTVYAVTIAPVLGFAQSGPQLVADRYSYVACVGFAILLGGGLARLLETDVFRRRRALRAVLALALAVLFTALQGSTFRQCDVWKSSSTLWTHAIRVDPNNSVAHANLGDIYASLGEFSGALAHYRRSLELQPRDPITTHHAADTLAKTGNKPGAIALYERALQLDPGRAPVYTRLAQLLVDDSRPHDAAALLRNRMKTTPDDWQAAAFLADLLATHPDAQVRDGAEAVLWASRWAQSLGFHDAPSLLTAATALAEAGRFEESIRLAEKAAQLADQTGDASLGRELERRLVLFRQGKPYHFGG